MAEHDALNLGLFRLHQVFCVLIFSLCALAVIVALRAVFQGRVNWGLLALAGLMLPVAIAHGYAARGARLGRTYGRRITRIIAVFWLIGFPVGTALAIFVFSRTRRRAWTPATDIA